MCSPSARPHVGIIATAKTGYTIVEICSEERIVRVRERVTAEAVACQLASNPPADPLFYVPSKAEEMSNKQDVSFLPSRSDLANVGPGSRFSVKKLPPSLYLPDPVEGISSVQRAKDCILSNLLKDTDAYNLDDDITDDSILKTESRKLRLDDFTLVVSPAFSDDNYSLAQPLHLETATQLGLMSDPSIPSLVECLVSDAAPAHTHRFLRRWLLTPPPANVSEAMAQLIYNLKVDNRALINLRVPPIGKVLSLVRAGQASDTDEFFLPRDRNGKILSNRYTTTKVQDALSNYVEACEDASRAVKAALTQLSHRMCEGHLPVRYRCTMSSIYFLFSFFIYILQLIPTFVRVFVYVIHKKAVTQAAHTNLILSTAANHNVLALRLESDLKQAIGASPPNTLDTDRHRMVDIPLTATSHNDPATLQRILDPSAPVPVTTTPPHAQSPPVTPATERKNDDHSVATIVMAQRDRLRAV